MHDRGRLRTCVALAMLMVGLTDHAFAQTTGADSPLSERPWDANDSLTAARQTAARAARSSTPLRVPESKSVGSFLTFDAPGAVHGTFPVAVSGWGAVIGYYIDAKFLYHGFLRDRNGRLVTLDVPGAVNGTFPAGINDEGTIVGEYGDNVGSGVHSFLREPDGHYLTFDPPVPNLGSAAHAVSWDGTTTGSYTDEKHVGLGYLRTRSGKILTFEAPGANATTLPFGTSPLAITADKIIGIYSHGTRMTSGFLLNASGQFTEITGPGGLGHQFDPYNAGPPLSMNRSGEIAGTYFAPISGNPFGGNYRVFVRSREGTYVTFDAATYSPCCIWSAPSGINGAGTVTGSFNDGFDINHGFWRTRNGTVTTFDVPGAGTGLNQGTLPIGVTEDGVIAGEYRDAKSSTHGFLFRPKCFGR